MRFNQIATIIINANVKQPESAQVWCEVPVSRLVARILEINVSPITDHRKFRHEAEAAEWGAGGESGVVLGSL